MPTEIIKTFDLSARVTVVTGAAGGLGGAMVQGLRGAGARVMAADIKEPKIPLGKEVCFAADRRLASKRSGRAC